jgi:hypothetical protein
VSPGLGRTSDGSSDRSVAARIDTHGEASGLRSTCSAASGGGFERRNVRLSTRSTPATARSRGVISFEIVNSVV